MREQACKWASKGDDKSIAKLEALTLQQLNSPNEVNCNHLNLDNLTDMFIIY